MEKKKVYVCGKVGEKKFHVFKGLLDFVNFYDSVKMEDMGSSSGNWDHFSPFEHSLKEIVVVSLGGAPAYVDEILCEGIRRADLVLAYFETPDAFGSLVEIGYASALGKEILIVFDERVVGKGAVFEYKSMADHNGYSRGAFQKVKGEVKGKLEVKMTDVYRLAAIMPGVSLSVVNPELPSDRAKLFLLVASKLGIDEMPIKKAYLYERQEGKCSGCVVKLPERNLTIDHIIPKVQTGNKYDDRLHNLQLLCQPCNSMKGTGTQERLITRLGEVGLRRVISDDGSGTETGIG